MMDSLFILTAAGVLLTCSIFAAWGVLRVAIWIHDRKEKDRG